MDRRPRLRNGQNRQRQNWRLQDVPSGNKVIQIWHLINERPLLADCVEEVGPLLETHAASVATFVFITRSLQETGTLASSLGFKLLADRQRPDAFPGGCEDG